MKKLLDENQGAFLTSYRLRSVSNFFSSALCDAAYLQPVRSKPMKQRLLDTRNTTCIPLRKISGLPGIRAVTRYPAFMLITENKMLVAREIPTTIPKFRTSELMLPAIPNCFRSTVDIISELLGIGRGPNSLQA